MDRASVQERFGIIGQSAALHHVIDQMRLVARTDVNVLVQGESGVGKEVIAKAIHSMSPRRHKSLIVVNCGAIPEGLIESELFGAEKGAYTGATERRHGHFEEADGGSIFLDEIGEMPLAAQVRLLRVLETGEYSRVGSSVTLNSDARVIAATNKELAKEVQAGRFREDLYYRLSTVIIKVPPLRERTEDILPILDSFVHQFAQKYNSSAKRLTDDARHMLMRYRWPGNVRELRNLAEQMIVLVPKNEIGVEDIRPFMRGVTSTGASNELVLASDLRSNWQGNGEPDAGSNDVKLIFRALLELRLEIREMKDQFRAAFGQSRRTEQHDNGETYSRGEAPIFYDPYDTDKPLLPAVEDIPYEIEAESNQDVTRNDFGKHHVDQEDEPAFPTLEAAEQELITEALKHFKGNRRQTARALGISERTLYRKLKELDEDL